MNREEVFSYIQSQYGINEEYPFEGVVSVDNVVFGVLAEYLLFKGRYEESSTYFDAFLNSLKKLSLSSAKGKIKSREWF